MLSLLRHYRAGLEGLVVERLLRLLRAEAAILEAGLEVGAGGTEVEVLGVGEAGGVVGVELGGINLGGGAWEHIGLARRLPLIHDRSCACTRWEVSLVSATRSSRSERAGAGARRAGTRRRIVLRRRRGACRGQGGWREGAYRSLVAGGDV